MTKTLTCFDLIAGTVQTLCRKFKRAKDGLKTSGDVFNRLTESADKVQVRTWTKQAETAAKDRLLNIEAMDIYNTKVHTRQFKILPDSS
jgi:hypothetical protein